MQTYIIIIYIYILYKDDIGRQKTVFKRKTPYMLSRMQLAMVHRVPGEPAAGPQRPAGPR